MNKLLERTSLFCFSILTFDILLILLLMVVVDVAITCGPELFSSVHISAILIDRCGCNVTSVLQGLPDLFSTIAVLPDVSSFTTYDV